MQGFWSCPFWCVNLFCANTSAKSHNNSFIRNTFQPNMAVTTDPIADGASPVTDHSAMSMQAASLINRAINVHTFDPWENHTEHSQKWRALPTAAFQMHDPESPRGTRATVLRICSQVSSDTLLASWQSHGLSHPCCRPFSYFLGHSSCRPFITHSQSLFLGTHIDHQLSSFRSYPVFTSRSYPDPMTHLGTSPCSHELATRAAPLTIDILVI